MSDMSAAGRPGSTSVDPGSEPDELVALLDELGEQLESLDAQLVTGESPQAQENRTVREASAWLARTRAREVRATLVQTRERARALAHAARLTQQALRTQDDAARPSTDPASVLRSLLAPEARGVDGTVDRAVDVAMRLSPGAAHAGIVIAHGDGMVARASSDDVARELDHLQIELDEGPSIDAIASERHIRLTDTSSAGDRWQRFRDAAAARGVSAVVALHLFSAGGSAGALTLYADSLGAFDTTSAEQGDLLASCISIALHGGRRVDGLNEAVRTRDVIGQAKGILRERFGFGEDRSFAFLVEASQETNIKLVDVARWLLDEADAAGARRPRD